MSDGLRQAALALHAMHPDDRHWAMRSLDASQRDAVALLLDELGELGIPRDATLLLSLTDADLIVARAPLVDEDGKALDAMPATVVITMLRREPAHFVDVLTAMHPWTWRDAWFSAQSSMRAPDLPGQGGHRMPVSDALRASVVKHARATCEALQAEGHGVIGEISGTPATAPTSLLGSFFQRWSRVRGGLA